MSALWLSGHLLDQGLGRVPRRPVLGGPVTSGTPGPTATPGGTGADTLPATPEDYATVLVMLTAAVFAVIGFFIGAQRAFTAFVFTLGAAFAISTHWALVAGLVNKALKLLKVVLKNMTLEVPVDGTSAVIWQLAFFTAAVLLGYAVGFLIFDGPDGFGLRSVGKWLNRLFGAFFGALTGATIAIFVLPRLVPGTDIDMFGPGSVVRNLIDQYGTGLFWSFVIMMIIAGLMALRPKPSAKVFN